MPTIFEVQDGDILLLDDLRLTRLLKLLLHLEANSAGIAERAIDVALNITVADGGEDGRIEWYADPEQTNFLPSRFVQFQCKATKMTPAQCAKELVDKEGKLKDMIESALEKKGAYVLFTNQSLNRKQKEKRIKAIRKKLHDLRKPYADTATIDIYDASKIQGWVNKFASAITAVLNWSGRQLVDGLITWDEWERFPENHEIDFVADPSRDEIISTLRPILAREKGIARIIGMSGLGKTRLALEICRGDEESNFLSKRTVYVDTANRASNLPGLVLELVRNRLEGLLVLDNCDLALHKKISQIVTHPDSKISLLTIHYDPEKGAESDTISLSIMNKEHIKKMLEPAYDSIVPDLDRIVDFAQGFPQMAVLLVKARLNAEIDMGSLTDDQLLRKMLWGDGDVDDGFERIIQACALFDQFGLTEEAESEAQFIADAIVSTDLDSLYRCIKKFESRGVIDRSGRYAQVRPKPLAIRLAADWWRTTRSAKQTTLINSRMPGQLEKAFCNQVSKLDFLPEVQKLTEELCGDQGPFGRAEVILSERGSRLFCALVEINPYATSDRLFACLSNLSSQQLQDIRGRVRRNLVWATEMLCFHLNAFPKAARSMLLLAKEENEDWSNNATGQFTQLYRVFLSGTEAPPNMRLELLDEVIGEADISEKRLVVQALREAIDTHGGTRTVGAEYQGSKQPLEEWRPEIWKDAFDYWDECVNRLLFIKKTETELAQEAKNAIAFNIRGLMRYGRIDTLDNAIREIVKADGPLWPEALESIKNTLSYDSQKMPEEGKAKLEEWVGLLSPETLEERLKLLISIPPYEHERDDEDGLVDIAAKNAELLAEELAGNLNGLSPQISNLLSGEQRQAFLFGKRLVEYAGLWEPLLSESISALVKARHPNPNFVYGMLRAVSELSPSEWNKFVSLMADNKELASHYPGALTTGPISQEHLNRVIELVKSKVIEPNVASIFTYGKALDDVNAEVVWDFVSKLAQISTSSGWVALSILAMYCHGSRERWEASTDVIRQILVNLPLEKESSSQSLDTYHWKDAVEVVLPSADAQFAKMLTAQILNSCDDKMGYGDMEHYVKPVLRSIFNKFGGDVWQIVAKKIQEADPLQEYRLAQLFSPEYTHSRVGTSVLSELPEAVLHQWCESDPERAPIFVALATDVLIENDDGYELSPRARYLLDKFGDNEKVLGELSANMGSFGWTGSVVPYHQKEIAVLETLLSHNRPNVKKWVENRIAYLRKRIDIETQRDAESEWGIGYD